MLLMLLLPFALRFVFPPLPAMCCWICVDEDDAEGGREEMMELEEDCKVRRGLMEG